jgi:hypothetical protein
MEYKDKEIRVYEQPKSLPWKFDANGKLVQPAGFFGRNRDIEFLSEHGYSSDDIAKVNEFGYTKKR